MRHGGTLPLWIDANNAIQGWDLVPRKDWERAFRVLRDYKQSLEPDARRGRPPNIKAPSQVRRIDPLLARQAYEIYSDGANWKMVAKEVLKIPEATLKDPKQREAVRSRVNRLIDRGETLTLESSEKSVR